MADTNAPSAPIESLRYDSLDSVQLAARLGVPRVAAYESVSSTLDVAHALAAQGAPAGTLILANAQTEGRGRNGRRWASAAGAGIWLSLIERPSDRDTLDVLSLRIGLHAARALDSFTAEPVRLKWPNDIYMDERKLAGTLVEARWREGRVDWVAIGFGANVTSPPDFADAASMEPGTRRVEVLDALVPALRAAAAARGQLTPSEIEEFATRDLARGQACVEPARGIVRGVDANGALLVALGDCVLGYRTGSLLLVSS